MAVAEWTAVCVACGLALRIERLRTPLRCWGCVDRAVFPPPAPWPLSAYDRRLMAQLRIRWD